MIMIKVQLAGFPSRPARSGVEMMVPDGATVRDVVIALRDEHPELPELRQLSPEQLIIAVNDVMVVRLDQPLARNNEDSANISVMVIRLLAGG